MNKFEITIFNDYNCKKKYFIKSNLKCSNKIKIMNILFNFKIVESSINSTDKNNDNETSFKNKYNFLIN